MDIIGWVILLVVAVLIVGVTSSSAPQVEVYSAFEKEQISEKYAKTQQAIRQVPIDMGWDKWDALPVSNNPAFIGLSLEKSIVSVVKYRKWNSSLPLDTPELVQTEIDTLLLSEITSLSVSVPQVLKTVSRKETTALAVPKNKSAIGRGVAGALVLGPVGAVLGAASALTPETRIVEHEHQRQSEVMVDSKPILEIGTSSLVRPIVKIEFEKLIDAESWLVVLKGKINLT